MTIMKNQGVDLSRMDHPHIFQKTITITNNYNKQLRQTFMSLMKELEGVDPSPYISLASSSHPDIAEWVHMVRVISLRRIKNN